MAGKIIIEISRILLGAVYLFSGLIKGADLVGVSIKVGEYLSALGLSLLMPVSLEIAIALCVIEFALGALLLMGAFRRLTTKVILVLTMIMLLLTLWLVMSNAVTDCGCFGEAVKLTNRQTFLKNIILLFFSTILVLRPRKISRLFKKKEMWAVMILMFFAYGYFLYMNYKHLPMWDFRPFRKGLDLKAATQTPEDAAKDEYKYEFIYEKDGIEKTFPIDSLPDKSWTYIDRKETLVKKGKQAEINDFILFGTQGNELSKQILTNDKGVLLMFSPNLKKMSSVKPEIIDHLYRTSTSQGYLFYGVSGATYEEINQWRIKTNAILPMLFMDPTTIKTIIRGNPGLLLIKNGKIIDKVNGYDFPAKKQTASFLNKAFVKEESVNRHKKTLIPLIIWAFLTLLAAGRRIRRVNRVKS